MISYAYLKHLDSPVSTDDTILSLPGYILVQSDHPSNVKKGWCLFVL